MTRLHRPLKTTDSWHWLKEGRVATRRCRVCSHAATPRLAVVGGGPAGIFTAIVAKQHTPGLEVVVYEASTEPLAKVLISGGGRCNVTNVEEDPIELAQQYPRGHRELRGRFFRTFGSHQTKEWFTRRGVELKAESDGRMFPTTDDSRTIADCLLGTANDLGIQMRTRSQVVTVRREVDRDDRGNRFSIQVGKQDRGGNRDRANYVMLSTGSSRNGYAIAEQLGHSIQTPCPSLFTFKVKDAKLRAMAGVSIPDVEVELALPKGANRRRTPGLKQRGPLLFTHWGVSGPAVLKLSAWAARELHGLRYKTTIVANLLPHVSNEDEMIGIVESVRRAHPKQLVLNSSSHMGLPKRVWLYLLEKSGVDPKTPWSQTSLKSIRKLATAVRRLELPMDGRGVFKDEFVTCGGVPLKEMDMNTLQSKKCPGLYIAGEVLDIDGVTGGFNFQSCWSGGFLAGVAIGEAAALEYPIL